MAVHPEREYAALYLNVTVAREGPPGWRTGQLFLSSANVPIYA